MSGSPTESPTCLFGAATADGKLRASTRGRRSSATASDNPTARSNAAPPAAAAADSSEQRSEFSSDALLRSAEPLVVDNPVSTDTTERRSDPTRDHDQRRGWWTFSSVGCDARTDSAGRTVATSTGG